VVGERILERIRIDTSFEKLLDWARRETAPECAAHAPLIVAEISLIMLLIVAVLPLLSR